MTITATMVQQLRTQTGAGVMECRQALVAAGGDMAAAAATLAAAGAARVQGRAGRAATATRIESYVHHDGRRAALVEVAAETDFVARTDEVRDLARNIAMQVAATGATAATVGSEPWIRDPGRTIQDLVTDTARRVGENIVISRVASL